MLGPQTDPHRLAPPKEVSDGNHRQMGVSDRGLDEVRLYQTAPCTLYSEAHTPTPDTGTRGDCVRNREPITRSLEGYGTEEECVLSDPQGESDADADIEDTDCRLQEPGVLQRISSRRRKRPRLTRQDTTESEDDGGRSQRMPRWNPRLSPHRVHSRTILEESVSQVRPLVIRRLSAEVQTTSRPEASRDPKQALWPLSPPLPLIFLLLFFPLSLVILVVSFLFITWASV